MPSVSNLFEKLGLQWLPDADAINAPDSAVLRADNLVPDTIGAFSVRLGSQILYPNIDGANGVVHSLHATTLSDGNTYVATGVADKLAINGVIKDTFDGSGDIQMADDSYQIFMTRGKTAKKFDGTNWNNWGIAAPQGVPLVAAVTSASKIVADFDNVESPACTITEGAGTVGAAPDLSGTANKATNLIPDGTSHRGTIQRTWSSDQNYFQISGIDGSTTDLFDVMLKMDDPRNVSHIKIIFGLDNDSTNPFTTDRFEFEFNLQSRTEIPIKDFTSSAYDAYTASVTTSLQAVRPQDVTGIAGPTQIKNILKNVGSQPSPTTKAPSDPAVWGHLTVTRGQFKRVGSTSARGWDTVRGFKIIYTTVRGTTSSITLDTAQIVGGGDATLTGKYRCVLRAVRAFPQYYELSPPSDPSADLQLNHQTMQVTVPAATLAQLDPQVDQLWVYLFGGFLDTYYKFAVISSKVRGGMTMDDLKAPVGSDFNSADKRARITLWGFTQLAGTSSGDIVFTIDNSEIDALTQNERLEPFQIVPPNNIVGVAGPWKKRMFVLTDKGYVYPSTQRSPGSFNSSQVIDLTRYGHPRWITKTSQGIVVGMEKDVVFLAGSGDDSEDLATIDLFAQPYSVGNPPIDACKWVDGNSVIYRSVDGPITLTNGSIQAVPLTGVTKLWRGIDCQGVSGLNYTTGRFRCAVKNAMLFMLAPEGAGVTSTNVIHRFSVTANQWSRLYYPQLTAFNSIYKEVDGTLIAGDTLGNLWQLEVGTNDNTADIPINLLTPISDGGDPLARKSPFDVQMHGTTFGKQGTITIYREGSINDFKSYPFTTTSVGDVYRQTVDDLGPFLKAQIQLTGSFNQFALQNLSLSFRRHPQHNVYLDIGYITPDDPSEMVWLYEVHVDMIADANVLMEVYLKDVLHYSATIDTSAAREEREHYHLPVPRGTKGLRPRVAFRSLADPGAGFIGFEMYQCQVKMASTGHKDGAVYRTVYPVGEAP